MPLGITLALHGEDYDAERIVNLPSQKQASTVQNDLGLSWIDASGCCTREEYYRRQGLPVPPLA